MPYTEAQAAAVLAGKLEKAAQANGTTAAEILQAMEDVWRSCTQPHERPDLIICNGRFALAYRRAMRPARHQLGGSSIRAIKRRAVRRPW